jgi:hypothetical protein
MNGVFNLHLTEDRELTDDIYTYEGAFSIFFIASRQLRAM